MAISNPQNPKQEDKKVGDGNEPGWRKRLRGNILVFLKRVTTTQILALLTAIIALTGMCQVYISHDTEQRQLRAYVYINAEGDTTKRYMFLFMMKNSGMTPALNLTEWVSFGLYTVTPDPRIPTTQIGITQIASSVSLNQGDAIAIPIPHRPAYEENAILSGKYALYFWGEVHYEDIFRKHHFYIFRSRTPPSDPYEVAPIYAKTDE